MDSANSGSLQSSSDGGDEDYDSRTESISMSSFLNHIPSSHINPNPNPVLQSTLFSSSSHHHPTPNPTFYDLSSASFFPPPDSSKVNAVFDPDWSRNIRPDSTFSGFGASATQNDEVYLNSDTGMVVHNQSPPLGSNANAGRRSDHQLGVATKNPKKRTRASRRAPTTVLTTDTTNFRQMVQEFTGIPTPPFPTASASPYSRRLDLFGGGIGPLYPVRPSPQKVQLQQPCVASVDASSSNYQLRTSEIQGFAKQPQTLFNSQNPIFSFQSHLQTKLQEQLNARILAATKSDNQQSDLQSGVSSSSARWKDQNENLVNFDGENGNTPNVDGYKLTSLSSFHHQNVKGLENVISSRNDVDQAQGNVDSWLCPSD